MVEFDPQNRDDKTKIVAYWNAQLKYEEKKHRDFRTAGDKAEKIYWDESEKPVVYPILHTVSSIKHSALYSEQPPPVVRKRFPDSPNFDQDLAQFTERGLKFACDEFPVEATAHRVMDDWQICGLGQWRLRYEADIQEVPNPAFMQAQAMAMAMGVDPAEIQEPETIEQKVSERAWFEIVPWKCFHWQPCRTWNDCEWVGYDEWLTPQEIKDRFKVDVEKQNPTANAASPSQRSQNNQKESNEFKVTEIYYKPARRIYVICEGYDEPLEVREDGLKLKQFFPSPAPLMANVRSKWLIPMPDYHFYKHGAVLLNRLWQRREKLTEQMKDCGFYDSQLTELAGLEKAVDGMFRPVKNLIERMKGKTLEGNAVWFKPIENKAKVLTVLDSQIMQEEKRIFRQTGITDIVQGMAAEQDETFGATRIKNNWAEIRLANPFDQLKAFMVNSYRMLAEVMLEHYDPQRLQQIAGLEMQPEQLQSLKDDEFRCYAVDIESQLSIGKDQAQASESRGQAMDRVVAIGGAAAQLVPSGVWSADFANAATAFAIRDFPEARNLNDALQALPDSQQQFAQMQQQIAQLGQQLQEASQQLQAAGFELQKRNETASAKDMAEVEKKQAETEKIRVETAQTGAGMMVPPDALIDERGIM